LRETPECFLRQIAQLLQVAEFVGPAGIGRLFRQDGTGLARLTCIEQQQAPFQSCLACIIAYDGIDEDAVVPVELDVAQAAVGRDILVLPMGSPMTSISI
jgi:hypothetical protein